jgi:hypothetical protein
LCPKSKKWRRRYHEKIENYKKLLLIVVILLVWQSCQDSDETDNADESATNTTKVESVDSEAKTSVADTVDIEFAYMNIIGNFNDGYAWIVM